LQVALTLARFTQRGEREQAPPPSKRAIVEGAPASAATIHLDRLIKANTTQTFEFDAPFASDVLQRGLAAQHATTSGTRDVLQ
jgi:hypothetical protein